MWKPDQEGSGGYRYFGMWHGVAFLLPEFFKKLVPSKRREIYNDAAAHPRRYESSTSQKWERHILKKFCSPSPVPCVNFSDLHAKRVAYRSGVNTHAVW